MRLVALRLRLLLPLLDRPRRLRGPIGASGGGRPWHHSGRAAARACGTAPASGRRHPAANAGRRVGPCRCCPRRRSARPRAGAGWAAAAAPARAGCWHPTPCASPANGARPSAAACPRAARRPPCRGGAAAGALGVGGHDVALEPDVEQVAAALEPALLVLDTLHAPLAWRSGSAALPCRPPAAAARRRLGQRRWRRRPRARRAVLPLPSSAEGPRAASRRRLDHALRQHARRQPVGPRPRAPSRRRRQPAWPPRCRRRLSFLCETPGPAPLLRPGGILLAADRPSAPDGCGAEPVRLGTRARLFGSRWCVEVYSLPPRTSGALKDGADSRRVRASGGDVGAESGGPLTKAWSAKLAFSGSLGLSEPVCAGTAGQGWAGVAEQRTEGASRVRSPARRGLSANIGSEQHRDVAPRLGWLADSGRKWQIMKLTERPSTSTNKLARQRMRGHVHLILYR